MSEVDADDHAARGTVGEVFRAFLALGLTSFGGPVAHLAYFRQELVTRRCWLSDAAYADLVALCQFLPGPASSQVGFALGLMRAGLGGALMAWLAFTLPSAVVMIAFAYGMDGLLSHTAGETVIHALKLVAVAVVAHAVWGMARHLCPDGRRAGIALAAFAVALVGAGSAGQLGAIALGGLGGLALCRPARAEGDASWRCPVHRYTAIAALTVFTALLVGVPATTAFGAGADWQVFDVFYRAGALVFGGGHVVLPLLESRLVGPGLLDADTFLAGYGAAQAIPGPLFTFAAYLGASMEAGPASAMTAVLALIAIFLPGMLLLLGVLPFWQQLRGYRRVRAILAGASAAVVGILAAALYQPVWTSAVASVSDMAVAAMGFALLSAWRVPAWAVVILILVASLGLAAL